MNDTLTASRPALGARRPDLVPAVVIALVMVVVLALVATTLRTPDMVSLTVRNPTEWRAEVSVQGAGDAEWTGAGAVAREGELTFLRTPDQGSDWVVRFSYAGESETVAISRDQLAADGWTIEVPAALAEALEDAGVPSTTGSTDGRGLPAPSSN